jgi:hypothetical protein
MSQQPQYVFDPVPVTIGADGTPEPKEVTLTRREVTPVDLREALADYAHVAWSGWMSYMLTKCSPNPDGSVTIPVWAVERWTRQIETPYEALSEGEKESDREQADKILAVIGDRILLDPSLKTLRRALQRARSFAAGWARSGDNSAPHVVEGVDKALEELGS